jgi:flagellar hook-basal body complex protein FliE
MMVQRLNGAGTEAMTELSRPVAEGPPRAEFEGVLGDLVTQASAQHTTAVEAADALARGSVDDIHGTMIAVKEAEISLKLVGSIRNKLLDAFQEIWRTNV